MLTSVSFSFLFHTLHAFESFFREAAQRGVRVGAIVLDSKSRWRERETETSATRPVDRFFPPGNELSTRPFARSPARLSMRIPRGDSRELDSPERRVAELRNFIWHRAIPMRPTCPHLSIYLSAYHARLVICLLLTSVLLNKDITK